MQMNDKDLIWEKLIIEKPALQAGFGKKGEGISRVSSYPDKRHLPDIKPGIESADRQTA